MGVESTFTAEWSPVMARPRNAARSATQANEKPVKMTLSLPADLARRFGVHAEMLGIGKGELFAEMIRAHCRRFVVHDHGGKDQGEPADAGA
jgi:hypothetical protein